MTDSDLFHAWWKGFTPQSYQSLSDHELLITLTPDPEIAPRCGKEKRRKKGDEGKKGTDLFMLLGK